MQRGKPGKTGRPRDERRPAFALRLLDRKQLRIYAWSLTLPSKSGVFQHKVKELLTAYLDSIGFNPSNAELDALLSNEGLEDAVPTRASEAPSRNQSSSLSKPKDDEDDYLSM